MRKQGINAYFELLTRRPHFRKLFILQGISDGMGQLWSFTVSYIVLGLHGSPLWMGAIYGIRTLPSLLLGNAAGYWTDRATPRRVILKAAALRSIVLILLGVLAMSGNLNLWSLSVLLFLMGILGMSQVLASRAYIPLLVAKEEVFIANVMWAAMFSLMAGISLGMSGYAIEWLGAEKISFFPAAAAALIAVSMLGMPKTRPITPKKGGFSEGLRWLRGSSPTNRFMLMVLIMSGLIHVSSFMMSSQFTYYCSRDLGMEPKIIGLMWSGVCVARLLVAWVLPWLRKWFSLAGLGALSGVISAAGLFCAAVDQSVFWVLLGNILCLGVAMKIMEVVRISLCHSMVPENLMGRVIGAFTAFNGGLYPLASFGFGALANTFGFRAAFVTAGLFGLAGSVIYAVSPSLRDEPGSLLSEDPEPAERAA